MEYPPTYQPIDQRQAAPYPQLTYERYESLGGWHKLRVVVLLSSLVVLTMNVLAFVYLETNDPNSTFYIVRAKWRLLNELQNPVDWLILGDSSANQGFDPRILQTEYGLSSVNLGTIASWGLVDNAWMLERYIERFGAPQAVLMIHVYDAYDRTLRVRFMVQAPLHFGFWEQFGLKVPIPDQEQMDYALNRYLPLYYHNRSIVNMLESDLINRRPVMPATLDGFMIEEKANPDLVVSDRNLHLADLPGMVFRPSSMNIAALRYMIGLAEREGFTLYLKDSPIDEILYNAPDFQAIHQEIQTWLRSFEAESSAFVYLDEPSLFPIDMLQNADHVTVKGAAIFTRQVAELILAHQRG
jgi:hypothetical protein